MTSDHRGRLLAADPVAPDIGFLTTRLAAGRGLSEIRNPHLETPVLEVVKTTATPSSILIPITNEPEPRVLLTRRGAGIRFGGHLCFPGGRAVPGETIVETALRECDEEIGLPPSAVQVLGSFGTYFSQAGYRIDPVVGLIRPDQRFALDPDEVASLHWIKLEDMLTPTAYRLTRLNAQRAYFGFDNDEIHVGGPTVSLMIGLLEFLAASQ